MAIIRRHEEMQVYQLAFEAAMRIFEISKKFPKEERYSLTDQIRRSSRSVCSNTAEAFRKRRYKAAFVAKLNDAEAEAAETQVWLKFAHRSQYINYDCMREIYQVYDNILGKLVRIIKNPDPWVNKLN